MNPAIEKLLTLAGEFPVRKRIDYNRNEDRAFCNEVLKAVKHAAPFLKSLALIKGPVDALISAEAGLRACSDRLWAPSMAVSIAIARREIQELAGLVAVPTTQSVAPETPAPSPSNDVLQGPVTEHSNHTPTEPQKTDDTDASSDRKPDTSGKPLTGLAKLNAARKAAAAARRLRETPPSSPGHGVAKLAPPPPQPPATP